MTRVSRLLAVVALSLILIWSVGPGAGRLSARNSPVISGPTIIGFGGSYGTVYAMSKTGYMYGASMLADGSAYHYFLRKPDGTMLDLGQVWSDGGEVSNNGYVVGYQPTPDQSAVVPAFWSEAAGWILLGTATDTVPEGINSSGTVVGLLHASTSGQHFFTWTREGGTVDIGGATYADVYGFNEAGQIAGTISDYSISQSDQAVRWSPSEGFVNIPPLPGEPVRMRSFGISEAGQVVGFEYLPDSNTDVPWSWTPASGLQVLFSTPTQFNYGTNANSVGQIAGLMNIGSGNDGPYFMDSATATPVGITGNFLNGSPAFGPGTIGLNGRGQVVGQTYYGAPDNAQHAFYWSTTDGYVDLGGSSSGPGRAIGITNDGLIGGQLNYQAVIWQVTPATVADTTPPTVTLTTPVDGTTYAADSVVLANYSCADSQSAVVACAGPAANGAAIDTSYPGQHTFTVTAIDQYDNVAQRTVHYNVPDVHGPSITISSPANGAGYLTSDSAPTLTFSCSDPSGVASCTAQDDQHNVIASGSPVVSMTAGSHTVTVTGVDTYNNVSYQSVTYNVAQGPAATITSPANGAVYAAGQSVTVSYTCIAGLGVASCTADQNGSPVLNGDALNTNLAGNFTLTVNVTDTAGHSSTTSVSYVILAATVPPGSPLTPPPAHSFNGPVSLGTLGGSYSYATAISKNGIVVGQSALASGDGEHGFVWTQTGGMTDLGNVSTSAVSVFGEVAGTLYLEPYPSQPGVFIMPNNAHAFTWTTAGDIRDLGNAPPFPLQGTTQPDDLFNAGAVAVNASGLVAGALHGYRLQPFIIGQIYGQMGQRAVVWKPSGELVMLPTTGTQSGVVAMNDAGQVTGWMSDDNTGIQRGFIWSEAGGLVDIGDLGAANPGVNPAAINASGQVVGYATSSDGSTQHAFIWSSATGMTDINGAAASSYAYGVNDVGQVVGSVSDNINPSQVFSWTMGGGMVTLTDLSNGDYGNTFFVNAGGQVAAMDSTPGYSQVHAVAWSMADGLFDLGSGGEAGLSDNHLVAGQTTDPVTFNSLAAVWVLPGFVSDTTPPVIALTTPADGASYSQGQHIVATYTCADAGVGIAACVGSMPNGVAIDTSTPGAYSFTVTAADLNGNITTKTVNYTVTAGPPPPPAPGHMVGDGRLAGPPSDPDARLHFVLDVIQTSAGGSHGRFSFWTNDKDDHPRLTNVFDATSIDAIAFSDDPGFTLGHKPLPAIDTVTFSGSGEFNDTPGYTFTVTATDQGEPGTGRDTFALTVYDSNGTSVYSASGTLAGGNIQSVRLPNRKLPPFIAGGPEAKHVLEATGPDGAVYVFPAISATDMNGNAIAVTCAPASASVFPLGRTHGSCTTAADSNGKTSTIRFVVVVFDTTPPTWSFTPSNQTVEATGPNGAVVTYTLPTASDIVDPRPTVSCDRASGRNFPIGTTTVACTAKDNSGNKTAATFTVTVQDTTPPAFTSTPSSITKEATGPDGAKVTYAKPQATDTADNNVAVACAPASGSTFAIGNTTVHCTAVDNSGNQTATSFTVAVRDTTAPTITIGDPGGSYALNAVVKVSFSCSDSASGVASCTGTLASGAPINTSTAGTFSFSVMAVDVAGNSTTKTVSYTVKKK